MTSPNERASLRISSKQASCAVETRKRLYFNDYGAYLRTEQELDRLILSTLRDGPLKQHEIIERVNGVRSHVQRHLSELVAQGKVRSLNLSSVCHLYFLVLPLDVAGSKDQTARNNMHELTI